MKISFSETNRTQHRFTAYAHLCTCCNDKETTKTYNTFKGIDWTCQRPSMSHGIPVLWPLLGLGLGGKEHLQHQDLDGKQTLPRPNHKTLRLELEATPSRLEAIASGVEAIALNQK